MNSVTEFMQLCRLCLVKDQVNIPIFEEQGALRHIFLKISACLPVKVSREDDLPKKICDECSYKLETLYQFWNTSVNSEKQLLKWLNQLNLEQMSASHDIDPIHSMNSDGVILKQEIIEETHSTDDLVPDDLNVSNDGQDYLLQQQQLSYQPFSFSQEGFEETEDIESNSGPSSTITSEVAHNVPKLKRRITAIKDLSHLESEGEDEADNMLVAKITKTEEQSDDSAGEDPETTTFVGLPSTSTDNEQPGPSGMGKESSDTPIQIENIKFEQLMNYEELLESVTTSSVKKQRQKRLWTCSKCKETFETSRILREHKKIHKKKENDIQYNYKYDENKELFICFTCDIETCSKEDIEKHVLMHEDKFTCEICNEEFVKPYEYSCHLYNHDKTKGFHCPFCKYVTSRRTAIMIHINTFHLRKFIYTCSLCGKGFNDCVLFKEHHNVHEGLRPFRCVVCSKDFAFSSYLTSHQIRNHRVNIDGMIGTNQCPICTKSFSRKNALENHMKKHEDMDKKKVHEKKHLCDICGKGFARTEKLRIHYRVHTGFKPYTCSYCAKSFTKKDYLIMHERVHSGEKPYSCEYCGKCFNQGAPLRLHIRSHTGERPYLCHICNTGFISRGVLNLHFRNCPGSSE